MHITRPLRVFPISVAVTALAVALGLSPVAVADRIPDGFDDGVRDDSLWLEQESTRASGCRVREAGGSLRFESQGYASTAIYRSTKRMDWNDGFVVDWSQLSTISTSSYSTRSGRCGLVMGWGTLDIAAGFADGINVEVVRTKTSRRLMLTVRKAGQVIDSASYTIGIGEFDYRVVWSAGFGVSLDVFVDGGVSPVLSMDGLETVFSSRMNVPLNVMLMARHSTGIQMDCRVDNFKLWGDLYDDTTDKFFDDGDSADDDDDKDGYDDVPDTGDDDGEDESDGAVARSVDVDDFVAALDVADATSAHPTLGSEVERSGGTVLVNVLKWNSAANSLVEVRVIAATGTVANVRAWVPTTAERARIQEELDAVGGVGTSARSAILSAVGGGATAAGIELEAEDAGPIWKVKFVTPLGVEEEAEVDAS